MKIVRTKKEFAKFVRSERNLGKLVTMAACFAHNQGMRAKALDPTRDRENVKMTDEIETVVRAVAERYAIVEVARVVDEIAHALR